MSGYDKHSQPYYPPPVNDQQYSQPHNPYYTQQPQGYYNQQQPQQDYYSQNPDQYYYPPPPPVPSQPAYDQSAQYYQPPVNNPPESGGGGANYSNDGKFKPVSGFNDLWAAILFWVHLAAFVVISFFSIRAVANASKTTPGNNTDSSQLLSFNTIILFLTICGVGFLLSTLYVIMMQRVPGALIRISFFLSVGLYFVMAAFYAVKKLYVLTVIFAIFGVLYLLAWFWWRNRIPFATIMLKTVAGVTRKYPGTIITATIGLIFHLLFCVWWSFTITGAYNYFGGADACKTVQNPRTGALTQQCSYPAKLYIVLLYCVFSLYWTTQLLKTLVHITVSGVFASYYFFHNTAQMESSPTTSSLKRACTTSFGSAAYGSLIIALFKTVRAILREVISDSDSGIAVFIACFVECLLAWIEGFIQYFNHYAFTQVAIYGKPYCQAAKDTWKLIQDRGVEAIINDNLIGNVLTMGGLLVGVITALLTYLFILVFKPAVNSNGSFTVIFIIFGFLIGLTLFILVAEVIESGTATTFVCLAEDPNALRQSQPELFEKIRQTYPEVVQGV
ncbi:DUF580-domain-containing protein [Basidiobolus meristosporus CBS 931.73]|uniref:Protein PNS1 n=1 Tax=Basidiobolus meristosporus CBS 931.73 TaxID=1314790 RepID=A0A1Y1Y1L5_9FUNG|nr:DUF580-domain-containing protein [Basidiobolus meristosporus CBS 931.73]|eukprot:ORX91785.1 DUF580-domain-containing protein [Basidiobolus meristosporus CBS 931.73]